MEDIKNLNKKLKSLKKEIQDFQNKCPHPTKSIKVIENGSPRNVCNVCEAVLGWPTKKELDSWLSR